MRPPDARRRPGQAAAQGVVTATFRPGDRTPTDRRFALTEARLHVTAVERVVCADIVNGRPIDDDTAIYIVQMMGKIDRFLEVAA